MGPRPELHVLDEAQISKAAPPGEANVQVPQLPEATEALPGEATGEEPHSTKAPATQQALPGPSTSTELQSGGSSILYRQLLRDVAITTLPVLLLNTPYWAIPRLLRPDLDFTAKEFLEQCDAEGESDREDHGGATALIIIGWCIFTGLIVSVYYVLRMECFSPVDESGEKLRKIRSLRQWWGAGYAVFFVAHLALRSVWAFQPNQADGMVFLVGMALGLLGFICYGIGFARQGASLSEPWASSSIGLFLAGLGLCIWLALCQQLVIRGSEILTGFGSTGIVALTIIANLVEFVCKRAVVASGCHPSFLGFLGMGIGVAASLPIRIFAFLKPTFADALIVGLISAAMELCGQALNIFKIKMLPKCGFPVEPKVIECFGYQVYTTMVFEITARVVALSLTLAADTRYYAIAGMGFGFSVDPGLVVINFVVAIGLNLLTNTAMEYLLRTKLPEINLPGMLQNKGLRATIRGFAPLIAAVSTMAVFVRNACLRCGDTQTWTCFD